MNDDTPPPAGGKPEHYLPRKPESLVDGMLMIASILEQDEQFISCSTIRRAASEVERLRAALETLDEGDPAKALRDFAYAIHEYHLDERPMLYAIAEAIDKAVAALRPEG